MQKLTSDNLSRVGTENPAQSNWAAYMRGIEAGHTDYVESALRCARFFEGKQWSDADTALLRSLGRPALTINLIRRSINAVMGKYSQKRALFRYKEATDGSGETADALTKLVLEIQHANKYTSIEREMVLDGLIEDRGYMDVRQSFEDSLTGETVMRVLDPRSVIPDPDAKEYEPKKWNSVIHAEWMSVEQIGDTYGDAKALEVRDAVGLGVTYGYDSVRFSARSFGSPEDAESYDPYIASMANMGSEADANQIRAVHVIDRQYKVRAKRQFFVDPKTGDMSPVPDQWTKDKVAQIAEQANVQVLSRKVMRIRWVVSADTIVLHEGWSPYSEFTIVPYFPEFRRGRPLGLVRDLISPQEQLNKAESQMLHIVNSSANGGWMMEEGALANMTVEELESNGAKTGLVIETKRNRKQPEKIKPNQMPSGLERVSSGAASNLIAISGTAGLTATAGAQVAGVALQGGQENAALQLGGLFDNLEFTRRLIADRVLECVQLFETRTKIVRIIDPYRPDETPEETVVNGVDEETGRILNDVSLGKYDAWVDMVPANGTFQEIQFAQAMELRSAGIQIPDDYIVRYSSLEDKANLVKRMRGELNPQLVQMQQETQMLQLEELKGTVARVQAQATKLQAEAQQAQATGEALLLNAQTEAKIKPAELQRQIDALQANLTQQTEVLRNKLTLADMHIKAKEGITQFSEASKRANTELKGQHSLQAVLARGEFSVHPPASAPASDLGAQSGAPAPILRSSFPVLPTKPASKPDAQDPPHDGDSS